MKRIKSAQEIRDVLPVLRFMKKAALHDIDRIALRVAIRELQERLRYLDKMRERAKARKV
jgi:hypothetical protein